MKTSAKQPNSVSHTIQSKTKAANQASVQTVLQKYARSIESGKLNGASVQRQANEELDDELLQGKFETAQLEAFDEDEEPLQGKFDVAQREEIDDDELLQGKFETAQREENPTPNLTGIPDQTKENFENMSGFSFDDVRVHYNSDKPAQLQALAYTQGNEVHIAPGQEKHLGHELGHVVQQKQGRVQPTMQLQGVNVNDNEGLEREADVMGGQSNVIQYVKKEPTCTGTNKAEQVSLHLDPGDYVAKGSSPYEDPAGYENLRTLGLSRKWIRFHVLNECSGGPGCMKNLTSTTQKANKCTNWHENFEKKEKNYIPHNNGVVTNTIDFNAKVDYYPSNNKKWINGTDHVQIESADYPNRVNASLKVNGKTEASSSIDQNDHLLDPNDWTSVNGWTKK